mgnify:CR=1 FL=1
MLLCVGAQTLVLREVIPCYVNPYMLCMVITGENTEGSPATRDECCGIALDAQNLRLLSLAAPVHNLYTRDLLLDHLEPTLTSLTAQLRIQLGHHLALSLDAPP